MSENHTRVIDNMSGADALLWTIGRDPVLRPTVIAVMELDRSPRWPSVQDRFAALTEIVPRLRSHVVVRPLGPGRPRFVEDNRFELRFHLRRIVMPPEATFRDVLDMAQIMATTGFDSELPPWEAVVVEGVDGGRAALIVKVHHALVDGVGGLAVLMHLLDRHRRAASPRAHAPATPPDKTPLDLLKRLPSPRRLFEGALGAATHPAGAIDQLVSTGTSVARLLAPARQPLSSLMNERSFRRTFEVLDLDLDALREAARSSRGTLNDAFVASVVRGLGRYHASHGIALDGLRVLMPLSVRQEGDADAGNHFVPARFVVSVPAEAADCLREVTQITCSWKHAPGLALNAVMATGLSMLPEIVTTAMWGSMLKGDDFCATNVPGPPFETYLAGSRIERIYAFAPPSGAALNVSLVSSAGRACVGINVDAAAIPDSSNLTGCLEDGFGDILRLGRTPHCDEP